MILTPGDAGWDAARQARNPAVDQRPAAVAVPQTARDVADAITFARRRGLRVTAQATGHGAAPLGPLTGTLLVKTHAMRCVRIDPATQIARVGAGAVWQDVADAAAEHGLAWLAGASPDVGVAGYTLGGGISWLSRAYGLSSSNVTAIELVTADGHLLRADARHEPELFWALRGGGGSFGIVTAIELRLFPVSEVYAGLLWWPVEAGPQVLRAWRELTQSGPPDQFTTLFRYQRFPAGRQVPRALRGGSFAVVDVVHTGSPAGADALLAPLRVTGPIKDTIQTIPARELGHLDIDLQQPPPAAADGLLLADLPAEAASAFDRAAGPAAPSPLVWAELRQIGGEISRARPGNGALAAIDASYTLLAAATAPDPHATPTAAAHVEAVTTAMAPWAARQMFLNIAETHRDPASFWTPSAYDRLRRIKTAADPGNLIRSNHEVPPAD